MTSKESLFAILNAVGGLMFLAVLVTVCLAMAAAPVALFIWLVSLMLKFFVMFTYAGRRPLNQRKIHET